jgi:hypothetical protein
MFDVSRPGSLESDEDGSLFSMSDGFHLAGYILSPSSPYFLLQNPKVMKAFQDLMSGPGGAMGLLSNPGKLQEMMADPEVSGKKKMRSRDIEMGMTRCYAAGIGVRAQMQMTRNSIVGRGFRCTTGFLLILIIASCFFHSSPLLFTSLRWDHSCRNLWARSWEEAWAG